MIFTTMELIASLGMISIFTLGCMMIFKSNDSDSKFYGFILVAFTTAIYIVISLNLK